MYKGGYTDVFKQYGENLYYHDINSSYPAIMKSREMPVIYKRYVERKNYIKRATYKSYHAYEAKVYDPSNIPCLLIKSDKMNYCPSNVSGWFWGEELLEAQKRLGCKIETKDEIIFDTKDIFSEYINDMYERRLLAKKEGDTVMAAFCKLMMNGLSGKFGQKCFPTTVITTVSGIKEIHQNPDFYNVKVSEQFGDGNFVCSYDSDKNNVKGIGHLVHIVSYITACARMKLHSAFREIGFEHLYYCDTDSAVTDVPFPDHLVNAHTLGLWKDELKGDVFAKAFFIAPKVYGAVTKKSEVEVLHGKGIFNTELLLDNFEDMYEGEVVPFPMEKMFDRSIFNGINIHPQTRRLQKVLNKRTFDDKGNSKPKSI